MTDLETLHQNGEHAVPMASAEDFTKFIGANNYVFANFYAPWCVWCQVGNQGSVTWMPPRESCEEWKSRRMSRLPDTAFSTQASYHSWLCACVNNAMYAIRSKLVWVSP